MSKPPRESEDAKEILTVRIGARMSERVEAVAEESDTKSEGYREVLELGLIAYEHGRSPSELEEELSKSIWQRVPIEIKLMLGGAILAALGLIPILAGVGAVGLAGWSPPAGGLGQNVIAAGLITTVVGVFIFLLSPLYLALREAKDAIVPGSV